MRRRSQPSNSWKNIPSVHIDVTTSLKTWTACTANSCIYIKSDIPGGKKSPPSAPRWSDVPSYKVCIPKIWHRWLHQPGSIMCFHGSDSGTTAKGHLQKRLSDRRTDEAISLQRFFPSLSRKKWLRPNRVLPFALTQAYHHPHHLHHAIMLLSDFFFPPLPGKSARLAMKIGCPIFSRRTWVGEGRMHITRRDWSLWTGTEVNVRDLAAWRREVALNKQQVPTSTFNIRERWRPESALRRNDRLAWIWCGS